MNDLFGNFHVNWSGSMWFGNWCDERGIPDPFIGWVSGCNNGDSCHLGTNKADTHLAIEWCEALERKEPAIADLGRELLANPPKNLRYYQYPLLDGKEDLSEEEWGRRTVAAWYAILRYGIAHGDTLFYC